MTGVTIETVRQRADMLISIRECTACNQRFVGRGPVPPSGPTPSPLMLLVDAPTFLDDRKGKVTHDGEPSRLLRRQLAGSGVDLDTVFLAHVVSCWPGRDATVTVGLRRSCAHNLRSQIRTCDPKVIVTLGNVALEAVTDRKRTLKTDRGKPFRCEAGPAIDRWVFPTWHPAAFKYDGRDRSKMNTFSADIASAVRLLREVEGER